MTHTLDGNLVMLAEFAVRPDRLDAFMDYTTRNLAVSRGYPGNIRFDMLVDEDRPTTIFFYEVWATAAAQQAYMAWRTAAGDLTTLLAFLAAAPRFTALRSVAA